MNQILLKKDFKKKEAYDTAQFNGFDKESQYGGDALYQQDDVATNAKVAYEVDHSLRFRNDFKDENHRGAYKGDEFDVEYKATDVQGGYKGVESDRQAKLAAYEGADSTGDLVKGGKYYGDDYLKFGDTDTDIDYRAKGEGYPFAKQNPKYNAPKLGPGDKGYIGEGYGSGYGDDDLYSRFKGTDKKGSGNGLSGEGYGPGYGGEGGRTYYPYGERYRVKDDLDKDTDYRAYGADFEGKDYFGKKFDAEAYAGKEEKIKDNFAFDQGNYRDVKAKGKNKAAQYQGDYQTNNKAHDVDFNVKHYEDLQQDLRNDVKSDQYVAAYEGNDFKGAFDADRKFGAYNDQELVRKADAKANAKKYAGNDFYNERDSDIEANLYFGAGVDQYAEKEAKAKSRGEKEGLEKKK